MAKKKHLIKKRKKEGLLDYLKKESDVRKMDWKIFTISILVLIVVGVVGSMFTDIGIWYEKNKPSITPPNYVFPIVWTILYYLIAVSLYYSIKKIGWKKSIIFYGINLILNIFWSYLFFTLKNPLYAFIEIIVLWFSILSLIIINWKKSRESSYMLIPYLLWVSFASILNFLII